MTQKKNHPADEPEDVQVEPVEPHEQESIKTKFSKSANRGQFESVVNFAKENTLDTVAFVLLFIGLILIFIYPFLGELIIGMVAGFYFSNSIIDWFKKLKDLFKQIGWVKSTIMGAVLLALVLLAPMFFVGAGVVAGLKYLFISEKF